MIFIDIHRQSFSKNWRKNCTVKMFLKFLILKTTYRKFTIWVLQVEKSRFQKTITIICFKARRFGFYLYELDSFVFEAKSNKKPQKAKNFLCG